MALCNDDDDIIQLSPNTSKMVLANLFCRRDGESMHFFMRKNRFSGHPDSSNLIERMNDLVEKIQECGGEWGTAPSHDHSIELVFPELYQDDEAVGDFFNVNYIQCCIDMFEILDPELYRVGKTLNPDVQILDILMGDQSWESARRIPLKTPPVSGRKLLDFGTENVINSSPDLSKNQSRKKRKRTEFSTEEDIKIVKFIAKNNLGSKLSGAALWKQIARYFPSHTHESIKNRFQRVIRPKLTTYEGLTREEVRAMGYSADCVAKKSTRNLPQNLETASNGDDQIEEVVSDQASETSELSSGTSTFPSEDASADRSKKPDQPGGSEPVHLDRDEPANVNVHPEEVSSVVAGSETDLADVEVPESRGLADIKVPESPTQTGPEACESSNAQAGDNESKIESVEESEDVPLSSRLSIRRSTLESQTEEVPESPTEAGSEAGESANAQADEDGSKIESVEESEDEPLSSRLSIRRSTLESQTEEVPESPTQAGSEACEPANVQARDDGSKTENDDDSEDVPLSIRRRTLESQTEENDDDSEDVPLSSRLSIKRRMLESETEAVPQKKARRISAAPKDAHLRRRQSAKTSGSVSPTRGPTRKSPKRSRRAHNGASEVDEDHASESSDATLPRSPATGPARKSSRRSRQVQSDESAVDAGKVLGSSDTTLPGSPVRFPTRKSQIRSPVKFPAHESPRRSPVKFPNRKSLKKSVKLQTSKTSRRSRQPNNGASEVDADEASESSDTTLPRSPAKGLTRKLSRRPRQANNGASKFDEDQVSESSDATLPRSPAKGSARKSSKRSRQVQSDETEVDDISESSPVPMSPAPRRVRRSGYEVASVSRKKTSRVASSSDLDDVFEPVDNEGKKRRSSVRSVDGKQKVRQSRIKSAEEDSDISIDDSLEAKGKARSLGDKVPPRRAYTDKEDLQILEFIYKTKRFEEVRGRRLWQDISESVLKDRSWLSAKGRFKVIMLQIEKYGLKKKTVAAFLEGLTVERNMGGASRAKKSTKKPKLRGFD